MTESPSPLIRRAKDSDAEAILAIYTPIVSASAASFEEIPPTVAEIVARIERSHVWLVAPDDRGITGYAYAAPFHHRSAYRWSAELSVYVAEGARGRGVGRRLVGGVLDSLLERGYVNAFAGIALPNPGSVDLFESFGFEQIALQRQVGFKLGRWHDVGWWQLQLRQAPIPPPHLSDAGT